LFCAVLMLAWPSHGRGRTSYPRHGATWSFLAGVLAICALNAAEPLGLPLAGADCWTCV